MLNRTCWIVAVTLGLTALHAAAQEQAPAAPSDGGSQAVAESDLLARVRKAYADTKQYQATVTFTAEQKQARQSNSQTMQIEVAFDREQKRLTIDKPNMPNMRMVIADGKLNMSSEQLPGNYLSAVYTNDPEWDTIAVALPHVTQPVLPDVVMLTSDDPARALSRPGGGAVTAGEEPNTLKASHTQDGPMVMHVDPQTHLITSAVIDAGGEGYAPRGEPAVTLTYTFDVTKHNEPLDAAAFAFAAQGQASGSLNELMTALQNEANAGGGGGGGGAGEHMLEGNAAPAITSALSSGEPFELSKVEQPVVVLDFWATWCGPCREGLPHIQAVSDWAKTGDKAVAVYTVNVGETPQEAEAFWKQMDFTLPIVMDVDNAISTAYGVQGIPQTVLIVNGNVEKVWVGFYPTMEDELKERIDAALGAESGEADAAAPMP